jgi:hypothetical protein
MDVVTERPTAPPAYQAYATITGVFGHPVQTCGIEQAIGELVTCSRCVGT